MKVCEFCGSKQRNDAKFCNNCGQKMVQQPAKTTSNTDVSSLEERDEKSEVKEVQSNTASAKKITVSRKKKVEDKARFWNESGTGNFWMDVFEGCLFASVVDVEAQRGYGILRHSKPNKKILSEYSVDSFQIEKKTRQIFFRDSGGNLWKCDLEGENLRKIVGGNDKAKYYVVTSNWLFVVVCDKKGDQYIYQISTDLQQANIIAKKVDIRRHIYADDEYLYYITGYPNNTCIVQHNIQNHQSKVIFDAIDPISFRLYNNHLVISVCKNYMAYRDKGTELLLFSPEHGEYRTITRTNTMVNEMLCYLDHVFYIESDTGYLHAVSLWGGSPKIVFARKSTRINAALGVLSVIDYEKETQVAIDIILGEEHIEGYTGYRLSVPTTETKVQKHQYFEVKPAASNDKQIEKETPSDVSNYHEIVNIEPKENLTPVVTSSTEKEKKTGCFGQLLAIAFWIIVITFVVKACSNKEQTANDNVEDKAVHTVSTSEHVEEAPNQLEIVGDTASEEEQQEWKLTALYTGQHVKFDAELCEELADSIYSEDNRSLIQYGDDHWGMMILLEVVEFEESLDVDANGTDADLLFEIAVEEYYDTYIVPSFQEMNAEPTVQYTKEKINGLQYDVAIYTEKYGKGAGIELEMKQYCYVTRNAYITFVVTKSYSLEEISWEEKKEMNHWVRSVVDSVVLRTY